MHEVCGLLHFVLNKEAQSWSEANFDSSTTTNEESSNTLWSQFMFQRFSSKKKALLARLEGIDNEKERLAITNELKYCLCEESDLYSLFDRVMIRGLRVVYCPEVTDGLPYQENSNSNGIASNPSVGYLNLIQG